MKKSTHMRRWLSMLLALVMVCTLVTPVLADPSDAPADDIDLKIAVMSDTHYLSPALIKDTEDYTTALNSDRKLLTEGSEINKTLLDAVRRDKPDVLLISGDLTKDGELECHEEFSARLQQLKKDLPDMKIYVINGNHDVRNENAKNFNTADGKAVPAGRTQPEDFARIYDFVYSDESVVARYTPPAGKESGQLSYVAKPCDGVTLIVLDTCCYSEDNTSDNEAEHETRGEMSPELVAWAVEQISEAKAAGDRVIGMAHHGFVPHFSMEPELMKMYLVEDYANIAAQLADAGLEVIFTGHMHANDIAAMTTENGSTLYDIETGSNLTYPSPMRFAQLREVSDSLVLSVSTLNHIGPVTYYDATTGKNETIADVTEYGRGHGLSGDMLATVAGSFVGKFLNKFVIVENSVSTWLNDRIVANLQDIIYDLVRIPVTEDKTILDAVNYIYQSHLAGVDDGNYPAWVQTALSKIESGEILDQMLSIVKKHAFGDLASSIKFDNIFTKAVKNKINGFILQVADSMGNDKNFTDDNDALIVLSGTAEATTVKLSCGSASVTAKAMLDGDNVIVFPTGINMRELGAAGKTVTVDASATGAASMVIWDRGMDALAAADSVELKTAEFTAAFKTADLSAGGDVRVAVNAPELNAAQKRALGIQLDSAVLLAVNATVGGKAIAAPVTVSVAQELGKGESSDTLTVISIGENGKITAAGGKYEAGCIKFTTVTGAANAAIAFPFFDVSENAWFFGDVVYAGNNGLFNGTAANTFSPDATMTRAMLVTVLWRMEGQPEADASSFTDAKGEWYSKAVDWASANGIVNGVSSTSFAPDDDVTREQMAAILFRYAAFKGIDASARADISGFADYGSISDYAVEALSWANAEGIINGSDANSLMPLSGASRAEVAAILHRYLENCIY